MQHKYKHTNIHVPLHSLFSLSQLTPHFCQPCLQQVLVGSQLNLTCTQVSALSVSLYESLRLYAWTKQIIVRRRECERERETGREKRKREMRSANSTHT